VGSRPGEDQRRLGDRAELLDGHVEEAAPLLGDDRRAVGGEDLLDGLGQAVPGLVAGHGRQ
jgi:hypothetical protein